ncbi:MAG: hypothetical protein DWP97_01760 [Calditrichaeota bacterium]|nr:MAG: hypothetical protein DWP97_01760 [Calditrichota bacterium]
MLGIRHSSDYSQALLITEKYDSEICIQAPKNSELFISLINSRKKIHTEIILGEEQSLLINDKRSVIDIIPIELPEFGTKKRQMNIITVMRIDN